jgi:hypothetical protein
VVSELRNRQGLVLIMNGCAVLQKLSAARAALLLAAATIATAQPSPIKVCSAVSLLTLGSSADTNSALFDEGTAEIKTSPGESGTLTVVALGPILGSMDSHDLKPRVDCSASGLTITIDVTRSAHYDGAAAKNVLWRPRVELRVASPHDRASLEVRWTMRLSTGVELKHARTPPYREQTFPLSVKKEL